MTEYHQTSSLQKQCVIVNKATTYKAKAKTSKAKAAKFGLKAKALTSLDEGYLSAVINRLILYIGEL